MLEEDIVMCSDGSVYSSTSGGGWVLASKSMQILAVGYNPDTGHEDYQDSYRSEAQAKLAGELFIQETCKYYDIPIPVTRSICDNQGLIIKLVRKNIVHDTPESDIIKCILQKNLLQQHFIMSKGTKTP